jgi:hypothetical protein
MFRFIWKIIKVLWKIIKVLLQLSGFFFLCLDLFLFGKLQLSGFFFLLAIPGILIWVIILSILTLLRKNTKPMFSYYLEDYKGFIAVVGDFNLGHGVNNQVRPRSRRLRAIPKRPTSR